MKKILFTTILLFVMLTNFGQVITPNYQEVNIDWNFHPDREEYFYGGALILSSAVLFIFGEQMTHKQRDIFAGATIGAFTGTFIILNFDDIFKRRELYNK